MQQRFAFYVTCLLFGCLVGLALAVPPVPPAEPDTLYYRGLGSGNAWSEAKVGAHKLFPANVKGGVNVEIPMGDTGLNPLSAILAPYDKFQDDKRLIAYNKNKNIALLAWRRWNSPALSLGSPDADEILQSHGFKCTALDVTRLLRLTYVGG